MFLPKDGGLGVQDDPRRYTGEILPKNSPKAA